MNASIQLVSTDFDGTIFSEFEQPAVPAAFQSVIADLQARGGKWVINTGRDMSSLMEALGRADVTVQPDYLVLVEREIYRHDGVRYRGLEEWNRRCTADHERLFARVRPDVPRLAAWIQERFSAAVYDDAFSPFCLIAHRPVDADRICEHLEQYCLEVPGLTVVRNDVYARFSHEGYSKGTALAEIERQLGLGPEAVFAAGDHHNDLPMLRRSLAHVLVCPGNAVPEVRRQVEAEGGEVGVLLHGHAVAAALRRLIPGSAA
jgi:hydroxymethylpyrimidine pyrophosphatase-like HAD family hydrolase